MDPSRIPHQGHEHAMWKQDLYIAEQEGLRFVLAHSAAGHGQCKIAVGLRAKGFLTNRGNVAGYLWHVLLRASKYHKQCLFCLRHIQPPASPHCTVALERARDGASQGDVLHYMREPKDGARG